MTVPESSEQSRSWPFFCQMIVFVDQRAALYAETTASDAHRHLVAQFRQGVDPARKIVVPDFGNPRPVFRVRHRVCGQAGEGLSDLGKRDSGTLGNFDHRHPSQDLTTIDTVVRAVPHRGDQPFRS